MDTTTATTTKKVTKAQRFHDIEQLLKGEKVSYGTTPEIAVEFIAHERELLAKKSGSETRKPTKTQQENEGYKTLILAYLRANGSATCTELFKEIPELNAYSTQKVNALVSQLKKAGSVLSRDGKNGKTEFYLA